MEVGPGMGVGVGVEGMGVTGGRLLWQAQGKTAVADKIKSIPKRRAVFINPLVLK